MIHVHLDFETRCLLDLKKVGLVRYTRDPSFRILLTGVAVDDGESAIWEGLCGDRWYNPITEWIGNPQVIFHAFNAPFEQAALRAYGIDIPAARWRCTMARAYSMGFSGGLADVGAQVGLPGEQQKLTEGRRLVQKFCTPRARPSKANPEPFWEPQDAPEDWSRFRDYCAQDVVAERAIARRLDAWDPEGPTPAEQQAWVLDREINDRGLPVDQTLVKNAIKVAGHMKKDGEARMKDLTGGIGGGQTAALLAWCRERGYTGNDLQAGTIDTWLEDPFNPEEVATVLALRRELSQAAVAKFDKIAAIQDQGRVYNLLQIYGAGRTGRWAGRALQLQNLKRPTMKDPDAAADMLVSAPEVFEAIYSLEDIGSLVRSAIAAPPGYKLVVADLANIESRVLGWLAGCRALNRVFEEGRDPYKDFATHWLGVPEKDITKDQRNLSKPPALGCGYGLGPTGLVSYGDSMGVYLSNEQAESAVKTFRSVYHEVPGLWRSVESAFSHVTATHTDLAAGRLIYRWQDPFVTIELPSGRKLWYKDPELVDGELTYMGQNQYTNKWERIHTYGAKVVENVDQAIARDVLLYGLLLAWGMGLQIIGHVHDEGLDETPEDEAEEALRSLIFCMTQTPPWCPGLILGAEGYVSQRYRKG